ncbi:MAG: hypothetical protein P8Y53_15765 [Pseudolabrys sp.]
MPQPPARFSELVRLSQHQWHETYRDQVFAYDARLRLGKLDNVLRSLLAAEREDPALMETMRAVEEQVAWAVPDDMDDQLVVAADPAAGDRLRALMVQAAKGWLMVCPQAMGSAWSASA